jgi:zinc D-Ala-D-Ala carboxypeptidase
MMKLSDNFYLNEFIKSNTATRLNIDNTPTPAVIESLEFLANRILQPVRDHYGKVVNINSGYRCLELNRALHSSPGSQHRRGEAADFEIHGIDNYEVACWVRDNLSYDQLILEFYDGTPSSGWIHVSCTNDGSNRQQCLTIGKGGVVSRGLVK